MLAQPVSVNHPSFTAQLLPQQLFVCIAGGFASLPLQCDPLPLHRRAVSREKDRLQAGLPPWWDFREVDSEEEKEPEGRASGFADAMPCISSEMQLAAECSGALALPTAILVAGAQIQAKKLLGFCFFQKLSSACEDATSSCFVPKLVNFPLPQNIFLTRSQ